MENNILQGLETIIDLQQIANNKNIRFEAMKICISAMKTYNPQEVFKFDKSFKFDEYRPMQRFDYAICKVADYLGHKLTVWQK